MNNNYLIPIIPFHKEILTKGEGACVYDTEGRRLIDLNSGQFCAVLGHANKALAECIKQNAEKLVHTNSAMLTDNVISCSQQLHRISGDMKAYSILLSTGAEAVEFCIRFAKHITQKNGIICFDKGYHGLTLGAQSITFSGAYTAPHIENIFGVPAPETASQTQECLDSLKKILEEHAENIAAAVFEPIVSVGGMIYPDSKYFQQAAELCRSYDVLLILDECQTGFGRTGSWFAYQQLGILPDMLACAKGAGLGYPVSLAMFCEKLIKERKFTMTHYSSHQNDGFAAAIIEFGIKYIEDNDILSGNIKKGKYFLEKLKELSKTNPVVTNPRGHGLMLGCDLLLDGVENYRPYYQLILDIAVDEGVILQATNGGRTLRFLPSYTITEEEIDFCIKALKNILVEPKLKRAFAAV